MERHIAKGLALRLTPAPKVWTNEKPDNKMR
jgi:hypothetical protein